MIEEEKVFYLTDHLTGILEEGDDQDKVKEEKLKERYSNIDSNILLNRLESV